MRARRPTCMPTRRALDLEAMKAADIAWHMRLHAMGLRHEWITPNARLYAWESDLLTVTPEGHVCEVEIKVSRNDLKHDLLKPKHSQGLLLNGAFPVERDDTTRTRVEAHERARDRAGSAHCRRPNYFCFAMPCRVYRTASPIVLPRYAGIYTVDDQGRVFEERRPIQLHTARIAADDLLALARRMHYRYWEQVRKARLQPEDGSGRVSGPPRVSDDAEAP